MRPLIVVGSGILAGILTCVLADKVVVEQPSLAWLPFGVVVGVGVLSARILGYWRR